MSKIQYFLPMFERLTPRTPFKGGRITDTDPLDLTEAARFASVHAGAEITPADFLRAAGRGEITLRAIVHRTAKVQKHDGGIYCNGGQENENKVPAGVIATLPLTACQHLAAAGRASWRTFDGFDMVDGVLQRYTKGHVVAGEPDFETVPDDCRVVGYDVHALADAFIEPEPERPEATTPAPVGADGSAKPRSNKSEKTLIFEATVLELMGKFWNDRTPGTEPTKGDLHKLVYAEILRTHVRGARKTTPGMVCDAAKPWKAPLVLSAFVPDSKFNDKRHPFKGDK